tara:strand:+ start:86 stop:1534 length:1449 start_codon:yes stop_codon:yes gene_type:complete
MTESNRLLKSSFWVLVVSWLNRAMGLVSVFILARLLSPEAFGAFAVLTITVQIADVLTNFGVEQYYIQKKDATLNELNSCWSFNLLIKLLVSVLLFIASPLIAEAFDKKNLTVAFQAISLLPALNAFNNGYIFHLKRTLAFQKFVTFSAAGQLIGSVCSVAIAFMYETYWALIIGLGVNTAIQVLLSYIILSYRTKFTTSQLLISFAFGKWMILKNIVGHARAKFDVWYAASTFSLHNIGGYNTMKDIAMLPARELIGPVFQVLYSYMSQEKASKERIYVTCLMMLLIAIPSAVGLYLLADDLTPLLLGDEWTEYGPVLANLAVLTLSFTAGNVISDAIISRGKVKHVFVYDLSTLLISVAALAFFHQFISSPTNLSAFRASIGIFMLFSGLFWLSYCLELTFSRLLRALTGSSIAAAIMGGCIAFTLTLPIPFYLSLMLSVSLGIGVYFAALFLVVKTVIFSQEDRHTLTAMMRMISARFF